MIESQELVTYRAVENTALITLNRPAKRNAIDAAMTRALRAALERFEGDETALCGVLTGAGKVFCAGMDLAAFANGEGEEILFGHGHFGGFVAYKRSKPMIAAVNGAALAGGMELALACDLIVAERGARLGLPEVTRGLVAGAGGAFRLPLLMPPLKALELILTGQPMAVEEAERFGLVNRLAEPGEVVEAALTLAGEIARNAPLAVKESLRLATAARRQQQEALWPQNDQLLRAISASDDALEGARAFTEKRPPRWRGH